MQEYWELPLDVAISTVPAVWLVARAFHLKDPVSHTPAVVAEHVVSNHR
jgi:hypothetical protein